MWTTHCRRLFICALITALSLIIVASPALATIWYVAPSGQTGNAGTQNSPWDITSAFLGHSGAVQAGDTIYLMDGRYDYWYAGLNVDENGGLMVQLMGTAAQRITICPAPGAHPIINGGIWVGHKVNYGGPDILYPSNYTDFLNIDFCTTAWIGDVISTQTGPWPSDIPSPFGGVGLKVGTGNRVINCPIHAASEGVTTEVEDVGSTVYGCLIYGNGWNAPDRGHGHCFYTQNKDPNKLHSDNICYTRYVGQLAMQAYGTGGTWLNHFWLVNNIAMSGDEFFLGGGAYVDDGHIIGNISLVPVWLGYSWNQQSTNTNCEVRDNYIVNTTLNIWWCQNPILSNNTVINGSTNIYPIGSTNAQVTPGQSIPSTPTIFLKPNAFDHMRGHLVIFNWNSSANVTVDLSSVVSPGAPFKLLNPKDFYGTPYYQGTTDGSGQASIPMPAGVQANVWVVLSSDPNANMVPTVEAGANQTTHFPTNSVSLSGTVSDDGKPSGAAVTQTWSMTSGPGTVTFGDANAAATTATFSTTGTYLLRLTATDTQFTNFDELTVTYLGNQAPVVNAGADKSITAPATSVSVAGTVSDDGLPLAATVTHTWTTTSGPGTVTFGDASALATTATFSTTGVYVLRLTASDTEFTAYDECTILVNTSGGGQPYGGVAWSIPGTIQAENYDLGGQGVAYNDTDPTVNTGGAYRPSEGVDIRVCNAPYGGYLVKDIYAGEWLNYTCAVTADGNYIISVGTMGTNSGKYMHVTLDGIDVTGRINLPVTSDWDTAVLTAAPACRMTAGIHVLRLCFDVTDFNLDYFTVTSTTPINQAPVITMPANVITSMPGAASAGAVALNATVSDDGLVNPVVLTWSVVSAPTNGTVTFTNANAASTTAGFTRIGTYQLQLDANDGALHATGTMTVTVQLDPRADFDKNGVVDGLDFLAWQRNYNHGTAASGAPIADANFSDPNYAKANGDANGDGKTDGQDYLIWQQGYMYGH